MFPFCSGIKIYGPTCVRLTFVENPTSNTIPYFSLGVIKPISDCAGNWTGELVEDDVSVFIFFFLFFYFSSFFFREPDWDRSGWISGFVWRDCIKWIGDWRSCFFLSFYDSWWFLYAGFIRRCCLDWKDEIEQDVRVNGQWREFLIAGIDSEFVSRDTHTCFSFAWRVEKAALHILVKFTYV